MKVQVILAVLSNCGCEMTLGGLRLDAKRHGLTGAEIDAALCGRSFDARAGAAVNLACALRSGDQDRIDDARKRAETFGLCPIEIEQVEEFTAELLRELPNRGVC